MFLLLSVSNSWGQQELRSGKLGATAAAPITSTTLTPDRQALDVYVRSAVAGGDTTNNVTRVEGQWEYETIAASQTSQVMGTTGAVGDVFHGIVCVATAASAAAVTLQDGTLTAFNIFPTFGAAGVFPLLGLDLVSIDGGWKITTSTNTTCVGIGRFS